MIRTKSADHETKVGDRFYDPVARAYAVVIRTEVKRLDRVLYSDQSVNGSTMD